MKFNEETHTYEEAGKTLISVTQLLQKHHLCKSLDGIPTNILMKKASYGTLVHEEISKWAKEGEIGFTQEFCNESDYLIHNNLKIVLSENIVYNDIVAGTFDALLSDGTLVDFKTSATLDKKAVQWQLSIYAYLFKEEVKAIQVHWFDKGELKIIDLPFIQKSEIDRLMDCERKGEIFQENQLSESIEIENYLQAQEMIEILDSKVKEWKEKSDILKNAIMQGMKDNNLLTFENDRVKITYVAPSERTTIDSAKLKKEKPELYSEYSKVSSVSESIRITIKGE